MQAEEQQQPGQSLTISAEDLDAALRLLEDEERAAPTNNRVGSAAGLILTYFGYVVVMVSVFSALPSALLVIWFDWRLGLRMLAAVAGTVVLGLIYFGLAAGKNLLDINSEIREQLGEGEFRKASDDLLNKRSHNRDSSGCLILMLWGAGLLLFPFAVWFSSRILVILSVSFQTLASLTYSLVLTSKKYQELKYFTRVSKLREQFEARVVKESEGQGGVAVSQKELELLGRAETKRAVREAAKVLRESGAEAASLYSVAYTREALDALEREESAGRRQRIREAVDSLQFDPRPPGAAAGDGGLVIEGGDYFVRYEVNDEKERLVVTAVGAREVTNAS